MSGAIYAGGSQGTCGLVYAAGYDRNIYAPDQCVNGKLIANATLGAQFSWSEAYDISPLAIDGGGAGNTSYYPFDSSCKRLTPWTYARCNNMFEVCITRVCGRHQGYTTFL